MHTEQVETFASLFIHPERAFEIPAYQRAYSWDNNQIKQFLEDLRDTEGNTYYLGHYLFEQASESGKLLVIDGQQRLTTCVLFFNVLCQELQKRTDQEGAQQQAAQWSKIFLQDSDPNSPLRKLRTVDYDNNFFERLLDGGPLPTKQEGTKSTLLLKKAHDEFQKTIKAAQTEELLGWGKLVAEADVTHLIVRDKKQAAQLFAFQNDRGKRLTNLEVIKSYLMLQVLLFGQGKQAPQHILPRLEERFASIYRGMTRIDLMEDEVLAYYWRSTLKNPYSGDSVVENIKQTLGKLSSAARVEWVENFVRELADAFQFVFEIEQSTYEFAKDLRILDKMAMSYPILLRAYRDGITEPVKEQLFRFLENLTFRYKLRGGRAVINDRLVYHFFGNVTVLNNNELQKCINQFISMLSADGWGWGWHWGNEAIRQVLDQEFYNNPVDNYLLWKYERYLGTKDNPPTKPYEHFITNESIEHIAPQTHRINEADSTDWPGYGIYHNVEHPEEGIASGGWLNKVGNLMLLAQGQNSRVSNRAFAEKLADFQREGQLMQHKLEMHLAPDPDNENKKRLLWDKAAIERRHKHIVEAALEIWDLNKI